MNTQALNRVSEQQSVGDILGVYGWSWIHSRPGRRRGRGFTTPDLVAKSRANRDASSHVAGGRNPDTGTIAERIADIVQKRADEMSVFPHMWNAKPVERRVIIWKSPQGEKLRALYTASMKPGGSKIAKTGVHAEAFRILKAWSVDPADGLR
jgi:hypothetical protein